jgi:L-lactate utilization protein LutB
MISRLQAVPALYNHTIVYVISFLIITTDIQDKNHFHLLFPAVHKTVADVAEIIRKANGEDTPDDADAVMKAVRRFVRPYFLNADIGMTSANTGIADLSVIVIETTEKA